ncbi:unnamed protein product [Parajaminaea phylloscopi]
MSLAAQSLCVFCGSSPGNDPQYQKLAQDVGKAIAQEGWRLVYGGGQKGLMGTVANAALDNSGTVLSVIPSVMTSSAPSGHPTASVASQEGSGPTQLSTDAAGSASTRLETRVVSSMHERKALMAKESGLGFVGLPGGYGTFEEVLEMVTWTQLGIHKLPIVLPNILGFWSPLQTLVQSATQSGFITAKGAELLHFVQPEEVDASFGGDWGRAIVAASQKAAEKLEGHQGYWSSKDWQGDAAVSASAPSTDFSGQPTAIQVTDLTYSFQPHLEPSLINVNLTLPKGSRTLLIGANGAGKSTLLRLLAGKRLVSTSKDRAPVLVFGKDVFNSPPAGITYLGTEWAMNPVVRSDIVVEDFLNSVGGYRHKERRDILLDLLDVDLKWRMHAISDGERRRVQLCMGLMTPWTVLLLDEVTVDLDVQVRSDLLAFLKQETEQRGATIVYATHIFDGLHDFPSHVAHMRLGEMVPETSGSGDGTGSSESVLRWPPATEDTSLYDNKDGPLLNLALSWLRVDRKIREEREAKQANGARQRGAKRAADLELDTDSEKFYTRYDYSQTVTR